ncbi:MAG: VWA domain-containing protein [Gammaproteobacteria bacterium]|nr:VWA domain-containing protein [Gammaproteobacteria bacterium]
MSWRAQRRPEGFNLAFLDIMSCGLGAIILIFMLVKYHSDSPGVETQQLESELANLRDEIHAIASNNRALESQLETLRRELRQAAQRSAQAGRESEAAAEELIELTREVGRLESALAQRKREAEAAQAAETTDDKLEQDHLIGLRVEGKRILVLLDNSASMADERVVDIVKIKVGSDAAKKAAPKWRRALRIARWIIERVPEGGEYMVVRYNDNADFVAGKQWRRGGDANARATVQQALQELHPQEATNLHAALQFVKRNALKPSDIYVITDSLPTKGRDGLSKLKRLGTCGSKTATKVSGECRLELFHAAIKKFADNRARVNAVLLPIEGDPEAAYAYWLWSASTTGMLVSPAGTWP